MDRKLVPVVKSSGLTAATIVKPFATEKLPGPSALNPVPRGVAGVVVVAFLIHLAGSTTVASSIFGFAAEVGVDDPVKEVTLVKLAVSVPPAGVKLVISDPEAPASVLVFSSNTKSVVGGV